MRRHDDDDCGAPARPSSTPVIIAARRHPSRLLRAWLLSSLLVCAACQWAGSSVRVAADLYTNPEYTFRVDSSAASPPTSLSWTRSTASNYDDWPFQQLTIKSFTFPYWYQSFSAVGIDPNGALHLPAVSGECCVTVGTSTSCSFFFYPASGSTVCTFNNAYYDLIAPFLTDLDPTRTSASNGGIMYAQTSTSLYVWYKNIYVYTYNETAYGYIPSVSVWTELRSNGVIVMSYLSAFDPSSYGGWTASDLARWWLTGLRQGDPDASTTTDPASLQQLHLGEWNTTQNGTYPRRASVVSGTTITFYPFGSIACNSPSIGDGVSMTSTYVRLKQFRSNLADFTFWCVFNDEADTTRWPTKIAIFNQTINALLCSVPPRQAPGTVLALNLREGNDTTSGYLPITQMYFTYYAAGSPELTRYRELGSRTGGGVDMRVCYECARLLPDLCLASRTLTNVCNTPKFGSSEGGTTTVVLTPGYNATARLLAGTIHQLWCVWSSPNESEASVSALSPNGLNPFLSNVTWTPATAYANMSWVACSSPSGPAGAQLNLTLAENNWAFGGGIGPIGAGVGTPTPLGMDEADATTWAAEAGTTYLVMTHNVVEPTNEQLVSYEANDYLADFLLNTDTNLAAETGALAALDLALYCSDCAASATNDADSEDFCLDPDSAAAISLCISPPFGDVAGPAAGVNATVFVFLANYPLQARRALFNLSCAFSTFYVVNTTSWVNVTIETEVTTYVNVTSLVCNTVSGTSVCTNVTSTTSKTSTVASVVLEERWTATYVPVLDVIVPLSFDSSTHLYSCVAPAVVDIPFAASLVRFANVSTGSVLVSLGENNRVLYSASDASAVFTYLAADDATLVAHAIARAALPALAPWASCFTCNGSFTSSSSDSDYAIVANKGGDLSYCFTVTDEERPFLSLCTSPQVSSITDATVVADIDVFANAAYPIATRATLAQIYCVFTPNMYSGASFTPFYSRADYVSAASDFVSCAPPSYDVFGVDNLNVSLAEFDLLLPLPPVSHTFVDDTDSRLVYWLATGALVAPSFSSRQFCTDCHATNVSAPDFTPYSPPDEAGLCYLDCEGSWNGEAIFDDCGVCSLGSTDHTPNSDLDCMTICFGPFTTHTALDDAGVDFPFCTCVNDTACFNISSQPTIGVSTIPVVIGHPRGYPRDVASIASRQYLLKSFDLDSAAPLASTATQTLADDPDFDDEGFVAVSTDTWFSSGDPVELDLTFTFPFFESNYTTVYLSSSGAVLFTPPDEYAAQCLATDAEVDSAGGDARVRNIGLLRTLFVNGTNFFTNPCANASLLMPYMTYLDPTNGTDAFPSAAAFAAAVVGMPTNSSTTVAYLFGTSASASDDIPSGAQSGAFLSIKYENVPYNWVAYESHLADPGVDARPSSVPAPPLYSFQVTLYASGKVSLKLFNVTDPLTFGGTDEKYRRAVVGLLDRPMPMSVLTQSAPPSTYVEQLSIGRGTSFEVEGAIAIELQRAWLPNSSVPAGVFPPRRVVTSASQHIFCPLAINACVYPRYGPAAGGTLVSLSLVNINADLGCIRDLLDLACVFGDNAEPVSAQYNATTSTLQCRSPAGVAQTTVPLLLLEGGDKIVTTNKLFFTWLEYGDALLEVIEYDADTNSTRLAHISGFDDPNWNTSQSASGYLQALCKTCSEFNPSLCVADCAGDFFGTAFLDSCGNCTGGLTGMVPDFERDCAGVCFGRSTLVPSALNASVEQCVCTPLTDASCEASALPVMSPVATITNQYLFGVATLHEDDTISSSSASDIAVTTTATTSRIALVPRAIRSLTSITVDWTSFPDSAVTLSAPLATLTAVSLPFSFPFFAQTGIRTVYISAWGAIFLASPGDDCVEDGLRSLFLDAATTTCSYPMVAADVAYFDLSQTDSTITYWTDETTSPASLNVVYTNMYERTNLTAAHTFQVRLLATGDVIIAYDEVQDPNAAARLVASDPSAYAEKTVLTETTYNDPPAPSYASTEPFWLVGVSENWYTDTGIYDTGSDATTTLSRDVVYPATYIPAHTVSIVDQKKFLAKTSTPTGAYPNRLEVRAGTSYSYCRLGINFCMTPTWGAVEGGALVRVFGEWGCSSTNSSAVACCVEQVDLACNFGGVSVDAIFNRTTLAVECVAPPGTDDTAVQVFVTAGGRRAGSLDNFVFQYNSTLATLAALTSNLTFYGTDEFACDSCASVMPSTLNGTDGFCVRDCADTFRGNASLDSCDVCSGGLSDHVADSDLDCRGTCFGPFVMRDVTDDGTFTNADSPKCICSASVALALGLPSCTYFPAVDGPVEESVTMHMPQYRYMLIALSTVGLLAAGAYVLFGPPRPSDRVEPAGRVDGGAAAPPPPGAVPLLDHMPDAEGRPRRRPRTDSEERAAAERRAARRARRERRAARAAAAESAAPSSAALAALE